MEDNEQTEQTIKQALNYRAEKHGGTTKQQWSKIMEETMNNKNRSNNRNKIVAVAASVLALALMASILFAVNQKDETNSANKGERVETSTTTTVPLTAEQELLKDTIILKEVNQRTGEGGQPLFDLQAVDGLTGKVDVELTKLINDQKIFNPQVSGFARGTLGLVDGISPSCDEYTTHVFNVNDKTKTQYKGFSIQYGFSPKGEQFAYPGPQTCIDEGILGDAKELNIQNVKSGKTRTIKPENYRLEAGDGSSINAKVYVEDFIWVDANTAVVGISITETNGIEYHLVDLSKSVSLTSLVGKTPISGGSDGFPTPISAARIDGEVYLLMRQSVDERVEIFARNVKSENKIWTMTEIDTSCASDACPQLLVNLSAEYSFGKTPDTIYGTQSGKAFVFDGKTNKTLNLDGVAIIKK